MSLVSRKFKLSLVFSKQCLAEKYSFFISVICFRIFLDIAYFYFLYPFYGSSYLSFGKIFFINQYIISWILFLPTLLLLRSRLASYSDFFFMLMLIRQIGPLSSIYGIDGEKDIYPVILTSFSLWIVFVIVNSPLKKLHLPKIKNSNFFLICLSWILITYFILWSIVSGTIGHINLDFTKVYEFRRINSQFMDVGILAYINLWTYKFFTIFLLCYFLHKKSFFMVALLLGIQIYFYGITAHKAVFFYPFLCLIIWYCFKKTNKSIYFLLAMIAVIIIALLVFIIFSWHLPATMLIRRIFFVPARLTFEWFDFFSNNPHVFWSNKILSFFLPYPYSPGIPIPYVVGEHLLSPELCANNGYISSGFAHAGFFGVIIYSVILGFFVKSFNYFVSRGIPLWFVLGITAVPTWSLVSSDLPTVLLSHGLLVSFFILLLIDIKSLQEQQSSNRWLMRQQRK